MKLGVNTHFSQGFSQSLITTAANLGASVIRDGPSQVRSAPNGPVNKLDFMSKASAAGLANATVFTHTETLFGTQHLPLTQAERQIFANNIVAQIRLHPGQIQEIEVWNEFNGPNTHVPAGTNLPLAYTALLKTVYQTVKPLFPDVKILGDSVNVVATGLIDQTLKAGAGAYMDGIVIHPYQSSAENLDKTIAHLQAVIASHGKPIPIYATEFGSEFADAADAPAYLLKAATEMAAVHVAEADWYGLQDEPWFENMGLVDSYGNLKPAASTFSFLEKELLPLGDPVRIDTGDDVTRVFRYGANTYVMWGEPRAISFGHGGTFYDALGHQIAPPSSLGETPIIMRGATFTLGAPTVVADSLMQFGDSEWTYFAQTGASAPVKAQLHDGNWNSTYTAIDPNVLKISQSGVTPAQGAKGLSIDAIERYTASAAHLVEVIGTWTPSDASTNGISLHVRLNGSNIYSATVTSSLSLSGVYVNLNAGDTLDFVVGTNGSYVGDATDARIQLVETKPGTIAHGATIFSAPTVGTAGPDTLHASDLGTTLQEMAGSNSLYGGKGNDALVRGSGTNMLAGGGENTASYADAAASVSIDLSLTSSQQINATTHDDLVGVSEVIGSRFADTITGHAGDNRLHGGGGDDTLVASAGHDVLDGGSGSDAASWASATHAAQATLGVQTWQSTGGGDFAKLVAIENLTGSPFDDRLTGDSHNNLLRGGAGNDVLEGGLGNDRIDGGAGINTASYAGAGAAVHVLLGSSAQDTGGGGTDTLVAIQNLVGSAHNDVLTGNELSNALTGGAGNDTLTGNAGQDTLTGGAGADVFAFLRTGDSFVAAPDRVVDFSGAAGDRIDVSAIDANTRTSGDQAFILMSAFDGHAGEIVVHHSDDHWVVQADVNGDSMADLLINVDAAAGLTMHDFVL